MNMIQKFKKNKDVIVDMALGATVLAITSFIAVKITQRGYQWSSTNTYPYAGHDDIMNVHIRFKNGSGIIVPATIPKQ